MSATIVPRPVMLVILDGWGWRECREENAIQQASTPVFDELWQTSPHSFLRTSGRDVGLPNGQMGNSEVGHLNIGAGRVVMQDLPRIDDAVEDGTLATLPPLIELIDRLRSTRGTCHLIGLLSPGGVHAHQNHALALAQILASVEVPTVLHCFMDGRDTPPRSALDYVEQVTAKLPIGARIGTVCGRYYAMDRDNRWDRVERAYRTLAEADGPRFQTPADAIRSSYDAGVSDEFLVPSVIGAYSGISDGDALLSFNFRADRIRELLAALVDPEFSAFARRKVVQFTAKVGVTHYSTELDAFMQPLFPPALLPRVLGEVVSRSGRKQLRIAETEKYPHVTYFLNGGEEVPYEGQDSILVPSPKVATYDLQPEMSAPELTDKAVASIESGRYDLIVLNYANPDMVGHTGILPAAIKAVEAVDRGLGRLAQAINRAGGVMLVTADHGNCELMRDPDTGVPHTAHTTNPVPLLLVNAGDRQLDSGRLADIAPTLLALMKLAQPSDMTGRSLIRSR